uniref:discoidin domain-containing protein n=1 Tax=Armatimonas sp. TaxID=1872638 RepID=UPI00286B8F3F
METYDIGFGAMLYRTTLPAGPEGILKLTEAHDWTQVFVDGTRVGVLDRRRNQSTVRLPAREKPAQLDVLVEAMGRINFGRGIHDRKGLVGEASLDGKPLTGWEVFPLPWGESPLPGLRFSEKAPTDGPAFHRGSFTLTQTGDTYLEMKGFRKGMAWINGQALGRFWHIGPQQTLYCPGCWLKKGKNMLVVLDLETPTKATITGRTTPILDELVVDLSQRHRKPGQTLRLESLTPTHTGTFGSGGEWQEARFPMPTRGRYLCLEALSAHDNSVYTTLTELELLGAEGKLLPRNAWKIAYADSEELVGESGTADNVFDLQPVTFWHTAWSSEKTAHPHQLVVDLGSEQTVTGIRCQPRQDNDHGRIKAYRVFISPTLFPGL